MSNINEEKNNFFFANDCKYNINKEKIILEQNRHRNSISTNETYENDFELEDNDNDEDMDFNQDFFPQIKKIQLTELLVDDWKESIKAFREKMINELELKVKDL